MRQLEQKLLGRTGREAQLERRERQVRRLQASFEEQVFVRAAKRRGLRVEPVKRGPLGWYKRRVYVNGKLCLLARGYKNVGYKSRYVTIRKPRQQAAICAFDVGKRFLIIPMAEMPKSTTMCKLDGPKRAYRSIRDWRKYLNNWQAFEKQ